MMTLKQARAEMRDTLRAEREAVLLRQSPHVVTRGQLIATAANEFSYRFVSEENWQPLNDTLVLIQVETTKVYGRVLDCVQNSITIAVEQELKITQDSRVSLLESPTVILDRQVEALRSNVEGAAHLGSKALGIEPSAKIARRIQLKIRRSATIKPNASQELALHLALESELSLIVGPPGTGKTMVIAWLVIALIRAGYRVLITAPTNVAVDNALLRLAQLAEEIGVHELAAGKIIRYGQPQLDAIMRRDDLYPPRIASRLGREQEALCVRLTNELKQSETKLRDIDAQLAPLDADWRTLEVTIERRRAALERRQTALQRQEQQRYDVAQQALAAFEPAWQATERDYQQRCDHLAQLFQTRRDLKYAHLRHLRHANIIAAQLAEMNGRWLGRVFHHTQIDVLTKKWTGVQDAANECERERAALDAQIAQGWRSLADVRRHRVEVNAQFMALKTALTTPMDAATGLASLSAALERCRQRRLDGRREYARRQEPLDQERRRLSALIEEIGSHLRQVKQDLRNLERRIVQETQVVATTLTKVHMDAWLRDQRFDFVVIDEAAMATLPAIYLAASRADKGVVMLGDPYQLGAVVHSEAAIARRWLRRNVFDLHGVTLESLKDGRHPYAALLVEQGRMRSDIAEVVNKAVYKELLTNAPWVDNRVAFHDIAPAPGNALVLCDTSDLRFKAIQPRSGFRCNGRNALSSLMTAYDMLKSLPNVEYDPDNPFRVGIVTPYRPQAHLIQRLVTLAGIADLVLVGTIHRFQGLEFDCVVFDVVEAPSAKPAFPFIGGGDGSNGQRMINVAVTRARHKLAIVAHVPYVIEQFGRRDTLRGVIDVAREHSVLSARALLTPPAGGTHPTWFEDAKGMVAPDF